MKQVKLWSLSMLSLVAMVTACKKSDFLDKKPSTSISTPTTLTDFQNLLDNTTVFNQTGGLNQLSADEYVVSYTDWQTASATQRNAYIWATDVYGGDVGLLDWNQPYQQVFYANSVLDGLAKSDSLSTPQGQYVKGWALFNRAFAFYDLTRTFCKAYNSATASSDLGIPLRLSSAIDYTQPRPTLQQTFDQIFSDLKQAELLLPAARPSSNLNRPWRSAVHALLARIYLDMRNYEQAEVYANQCLSVYSTLIDYNTVSTTAGTPFSSTNNEIIYNARQVTAYGEFTGTYSSSLAQLPTSVLNLYTAKDLRSALYFGKKANGSYYRKRGYFGTGLYAFTGLATDEVYLIKAECLARLGQGSEAIATLNTLLNQRYVTGSFTALTASSSADALNTILLERRKELIWRGLRWTDLKRLNLGSDQVTLTRVLNGTSYALAPNDNKWVMPIPSDEIALSGIQQNPR